MTWQETHNRTRIIREVEAAAAVDMTGALPWREEWAPFFGSPEGLLTALRSRWNRMCEAQLDVRSTGEDAFVDTLAELRRTHAGILAILRKASETEAGAKVLALTGAPVAQTSRKSRRFRGGPVFS
ncbi:hypothetical protein [Nocardioides bizhenqiangii]|uniref:Uncharacterized protein n=1 Tax=Nocardioides bizhenqiangii TaxID=3095076 RepID=A0ABZ0ZQZ8_9ACTN|nr:hypothetical protein [Nocardioides sp. HM61]WQQ26755.1 hypothetical protein SHK19_00645 [Nocardioides sp. HM61]